MRPNKSVARRSFTFSNVCSFLALTVALGTGTAYAANTVGSSDIIDEAILSQDIKNDEVKTADIGNSQVAAGNIKPAAVIASRLGPDAVDSTKVLIDSLTSADLAAGAVTASELASNAVNSSKVGANVLTGADINESTLAGVNAATVAGMSVKKINFQVPYGTANTKILDFPGKFQMYAECQAFGDRLDVNIYPGENGTMIAGLSGYMNVFDDSNSTRDMAAVGGGYDAGTVYLVDNVFPGLAPKWARIDFGAPSGFVAHLDLLLSVFGDSCSLTGTVIAG